MYLWKTFLDLVHFEAFFASSKFFAPSLASFSCVFVGYKFVCFRMSSNFQLLNLACINMIQKAKLVDSKKTKRKRVFGSLYIYFQLLSWGVYQREAEGKKSESPEFKKLGKRSRQTEKQESFDKVERANFWLLSWTSNNVFACPSPTD